MQFPSLHVCPLAAFTLFCLPFIAFALLGPFQANLQIYGHESPLKICENRQSGVIYSTHGYSKEKELKNQSLLIWNTKHSLTLSYIYWGRKKWWGGKIAWEKRCPFSPTYFVLQDLEQGEILHFAEENCCTEEQVRCYRFKICFLLPKT